MKFEDRSQTLAGEAEKQRQAVKWDQITDAQIDLELAFSAQACFSDRCGDIFAIGETPAGDIYCTRASNHVEKETAAGFTPVHATGFLHNHSRVRWT